MTPRRCAVVSFSGGPRPRQSKTTMHASLPAVSSATWSIVRPLTHSSSSGLPMALRLPRSRASRAPSTCSSWGRQPEPSRRPPPLSAISVAPTSIPTDSQTGFGCALPSSSPGPARVASCPTSMRCCGASAAAPRLFLLADHLFPAPVDKETCMARNHPAPACRPRPVRRTSSAASSARRS